MIRPNLFDESEDEAATAFAGKRVLITGGLGFIGSNLAIRLVKSGAIVTLLDSLIPQLGGNLHNVSEISDQIFLVRCDMRDAEALHSVVPDQEFIFNLAGQVSHGDSMRDPQLDLEVNCVSTMNLVEACRRCNPSVRMLYTSTRQVYGRPIELPVTETHPTLPIDVNGINKLAAEYYHLLYHSAYGIRSTVLRLTNTYGPRQRISSERQGVAAVFLHRALCGRTIYIYGDGTQRRDFSFVEDVIDAMLLAITEPQCHGHVYNVGAVGAQSLLEFAAILQELCECRIKLVPFPADSKQIDIGDYHGDYSRLHAATGWVPKVRLQDGVAITVEFYRNHANAYLLTAAVSR